MNTIPPPRPPIEPEYEDVDSFPDQAHDWGGEWEEGYHGGFVCNACKECSDCSWCDQDVPDGVDCLRNQADMRNQIKRIAYNRALLRYEAQMDYYREITRSD
ncbi:hypothetical protein LITTLEE_148 [Mycobacterium phage LittleE]|uniref:Uncharacterized protein n=1 Tax=Mycobacterium phage LittleE TaxID=2922212 RepID=G1D433_9CAUD|nr:hypothetical protein FGG27_gp148 [Mycobacterium phage LittleE]AEK09528.1 hypothetical protein LITTLEE_148 [Mycobacterium phage LittleE]